MSLIVIVIPINSCAFAWKAIVLLEYYNNLGLLSSNGLTCELYMLSSRVVAIKVEIEVRYTHFFLYPTINKGILAGYRRAAAHIAHQHTKRHYYGAAYFSGKYASNM